MVVAPKLMAVSDIHVGHQGNKPVVERIEPESSRDWLIVAGDVAERTDDMRWALSLLRGKFAKVIWVPGNHELWTPPRDPVQLRGTRRYEYLISMCRELDVITPEDPFPVWDGVAGDDVTVPVTLVPMFVLYDYTFLPDGATTASEGLAIARERNVIATDEFLLSPDPYPGCADWCRDRVEYTRHRLDALPVGKPVVLINHFPLVREPTRGLLFHPEFSLWSGTELTADWHTRYNVVCSVYGHLHIPRTSFHDGIRFEEVSLGYPREWERRGLPDQLLRQILPIPDYPPGALNRFGGHTKLSPEVEARLVKLYAEARTGRP